MVHKSLYSSVASCLGTFGLLWIEKNLVKCFEDYFPCSLSKKKKTSLHLKVETEISGHYWYSC
jgi:hypothetical protein